MIDRPSPAEYRDLEPEAGTPCGGICPPTGCWHRFCAVNQPSEHDICHIHKTCDALGSKKAA